MPPTAIASSGDRHRTAPQIMDFLKGFVATASIFGIAIVTLTVAQTAVNSAVTEHCPKFHDREIVKLTDLFGERLLCVESKWVKS